MHGQLIRHAKQHFEILRGLTDSGSITVELLIGSMHAQLACFYSADAAIAHSVRNITNPSDPVSTLSDQSVIVFSAAWEGDH